VSDHPRGLALLHDPRLNKGTAFTQEERRKYGLQGLLPPAVSTVELQIARRHDEIANLADDLQKFYAVLMSDPATYMPLVYTPTVGEACQKFGHIFRSPRGMYLPIS
jgi:malate dehydrogenase (oxaloacetate-decarboxylating)(NADP+)